MRMTKKAVNLSVDADLLARAKEMKVNLSATLEEALRERARDEERRRWKEENREAIEALIKQGLEERKQILYLLGPVGGGKSSLAERGYRSFVKTTWGPTKASSSRVTP